MIGHFDVRSRRRARVTLVVEAARAQALAGQVRIGNEVDAGSLGLDQD